MQGSATPRPKRPPTAGTRAFFFSDLRDYTGFVETHGDAEAAKLLTEYRTLVRREIARHQGAEIKTEGDSFYVVFDVPSTALDCAVAILKRASARADRLRIGIGLHAGETVAYDDQFVGSAVNIASRLAAAAGPGELVISDTLRGLVRTTTTIPMADRGPLALKGVAEPIRAWTVRWDPTAAASPAPAIALAPPAARRRPFASVWAIAAVAAVAAIGATLLLAPRDAPTTAPPVNAAPGPKLVVVAGLGTPGFSGDGGPATAAQLDEPIGLVFDAGGALYIADSTHQLGTGGIRESYTRIRRIDKSGIIRTIAGNGTMAFPFEGFAASARFFANAGLAIDRGGVLYVAIEGDPQAPQWVGTIGLNGDMRIVAGGASGFAGDGGPAVAARLFRPRVLALDGLGSVYVADSGNNRIRVIKPDGSIDTIAGNGTRGSTGDGGPAREASFFAPLGLAFSPDGTLYIADTNNHRVRKIDHGGNVVTVAGTGDAGPSGDGGPAARAALNLPSGLTFDRTGNLYIADTGNDRVRKVAPDGTITTVAGGSDADRLVRPAAVAVGADGVLYIADTGNHRVLKLAAP